MTENLKRCECGGKPRFTSAREVFSAFGNPRCEIMWWAVECPRCMANTGYFLDKDKAAEAWNGREPE